MWQAASAWSSWQAAYMAASLRAFRSTLPQQWGNPRNAATKPSRKQPYCLKPYKPCSKWLSLCKPCSAAHPLAGSWPQKQAGGLQLENSPFSGATLGVQPAPFAWCCSFTPSSCKQLPADQQAKWYHNILLFCSLIKHPTQTKHGMRSPVNHHRPTRGWKRVQESPRLHEG